MDTKGRKYQLSRQHRVKSGKLIDQLFTRGESFTQYPLRVFYMEASLPIALQAGFGVSARNFRKAVERNRIKRLMRETWRLQKGLLELQLENLNRKLAVFVLYTGRELTDSAQIALKMQIIINKLIGIPNEIPSPRA
jgi:ribonuclease P protein component